MAKKTPPPPVKTPQTGALVALDSWTETENERRFKTVDDARAIYSRMMADNMLRSQTFAQTRNQLEGGRPIDPRLLEDMGAAWTTNCNFGDAQAARDRVLRPYWKMVNDVPHRIAVTIPSNNANNGKWEAAFAECFDLFLDDWGTDYQIQFMSIANNYVNFGPGVMQWQEQDNARFKSVNVQRIVWPKNARMSPDEWELVGWVRDMSAADLYSKIRTAKDRKRSEYAGWNVKAVQQAITYFKTGTFAPDPRDYTRWQDLMVNNDLRVASQAEPLQLVWLLCKEFSGKIGCYVFTQQGGVNDFLFKDENYSEDFGSILRAIWYDTGVDSMVHSIKGFAIKNYFFSQMTNRVKSRFVDSATMALGINFKRTSDNIPDEAPPVENYGPYTVFPTGLEQMTVYPQIQQAGAVLEMLDANANENNSLYREQQSQIENTDTATQAKIIAGLQGEMTEAGAAIYLAQVADVFGECVKKLRKRGNTNPDAVEFVKRLREREVPDEVIFDSKIVVKTGASAGMANPAVREMKFQEGLALSNIPGVNGRWFLENLIANRYGSQAVGKALLPEGMQSKPEQRRAAEIENVALGQGHPLQALPSDAHAEHVEEHLRPLEPMAQAAQQGVQLTPEQIAGLTIGVEHAGQHMQYLSQDETQKKHFMALKAPFSFVQSVTRGVLSRQMQEQQMPA